VNVSFDSVATVVEKENDRLEALSNHDGKLLNCQLARGRSVREQVH
jgi:hypothetical protein